MRHAKHVSQSTSKLQTCRTCLTVKKQVKNLCRTQNMSHSQRASYKPGEHVSQWMSQFKTGAALKTCLTVKEQVKNQCRLQNMSQSQWTSYKPVLPEEHVSQWTSQLKTRAPFRKYVSKSTSKMQTSAAWRICLNINESVKNRCHLQNISHSQKTS